MNNISQHCHWYFPKLEKGIEEKSTTDSDDETLKNQSSIEALVRESIQNSLDVHDDSDNPVIMIFKFGILNDPQEQIPNFLDILKYIKGSREYILSTGNDDATYVFDPMISFMESHLEAFPYLCVSDYNTIGMDPKRFKAFTSKGSSFKSKKGSGGSYGIGKAAYYMASNIRTILVSSVYKDDNEEKKSVFEGFSKLTTNEVDGVKHYDKGYYDISEAEPIYDENAVPTSFRRNERGTSIFIMGINDTNDEKDKLYKSIVNTVIKNFWLAIIEEKLKVIVDFEEDEYHSCELNKEEVERIILTKDKFDVRWEYTNPRPYYEAVSTAVEFIPGVDNPNSVFFIYNHEKFGKAKFYLLYNNNKHDRFLKMRSPRMVVSCEKRGGKRGFNGVLVCDDRWNELLTNAEPPAHDAWDENRINEKKNKNQDEKDESILALKTINQWVNECIDKYFGANQESDMDFYGIRDLLYTDKDIDSNSRKEGEASSSEEGNQSEEGDKGIPTSMSIGGSGDDLIKVRPIASVAAEKKTKASPDPNGKLKAKRKKKKHKNPNPHHEPNPEPGKHFPVRTDENGKQGKYREVFDTTVRCFIPKEQMEDHLYTMVINSKRKIENAMVELTTGAAIGTIEVPISFTDKGKCNNYQITDIPLEVGTNILHFKLNDNISHSISVATYEFK